MVFSINKTQRGHLITDNFSDLYGFGDTEEEAWKDYNSAISEYLSHLLHTQDDRMYPSAVKNKYKMLKHFTITMGG